MTHRKHHRIRLAWFAILMVGASPALAALTPDQICSSEPTVATPGVSMLAMAGEKAESMLAASPDRVNAADQAITMLSSAGADASNRSAASLASYCLAIGEAFRLGRDGNPYEARAMLDSAFRYAEASDQPSLSALAAYRLSLVSSGAAISGARGRGPRRSMEPPHVAAAAPTGATIANPDCELLDDPATTASGAIYYEVAALRCAIDRAQASGDPALFARASLRLSLLWLDYGRRTPAKSTQAMAAAAAFALDALDAAGRVADVAQRVELTSRLGDVAIDTGRGSDPRVAAAAARILAAAGDTPALAAMAEAMTGRVALACGDAGAAAGHVRRAIFLETQTALPLRLPDWYLLLANADPANRAQDTALAYRALGQIRPLLPSYDPLTEESNFALRLQPVFEAMVDSSLGAMPDDDDVTRIGVVQTIVEGYRQAELQSLLGSECIAARTPIRPAELKPGEVLLYPILLRDRVELIYAAGTADGGAPRYHRLPAQGGVTRADVLALVDAMVDLTSEPRDARQRPDGWRDAAQRLYRILIQPVADRLGADSTLIVVPDGPLAALPFGALIDDKGDYLVRKSRVVVVPALAYAQPGSTPAHPLSVVAATLDREIDFSWGDFPALAGTDIEAHAAIGAAGGGRGRLLRNFHRADLVDALQQHDVDVLHLATHASFNGRSDRSYILADGELIPISDLRDMIARNQTRGDQLDLIVLSACETAVGDDQASMGLAGAAVQAGARSALASLWEADDAGTSALMQDFYSHYHDGAGKAEALRDAQLAMLAKGGNFADPNVWAAFTLLGGWR